MKKALTIILTLALLLALGAPALAFSAQLSAQNLTVNGRTVACEKYNIDGSNYFKLRDLAKLLDGTASQFDVGWDEVNKLVSITAGHAYTTPNGQELVVGADNSASAQVSAQTIMINGAVRTDLTVYNIGGSNFFKLREMGDALGFNVDYNATTNTAIVASTDYVPGETTPAPAPEPAPAASSDALTLENRSFSTSEGDVSVWVLTADTRSPSLTVRSAMVAGTLGATELFQKIVEQSGAFAACNGNFFESNKDFQTPIGHVMVDGTFLHAVSGNNSLGIDSAGGLHMGKLMIFTRVTSGDNKTWAAYEVNSAGGQFDGNCVLYTPAYGAVLPMTMGAYVMTVSGGVIRGYRWAEAGEEVPIPADGFVMFLSQSYVASDWIYEPTVGKTVSAPEPYLYNPDNDAFDLDGIVSIVSGSPRLVKGGAICTETDPGFEDPNRFGPGVTSPRTAVGIGGDGKLILVSASAASIQQLREIMLALGCVEAMNLDGGGSVGLYYNGEFKAVPGRPLTTVLEFFVNK